MKPDIRTSATVQGAISNRVRVVRAKKCCGAPRGQPMHKIGCALVMDREARAAAGDAEPTPMSELVPLPKVPKTDAGRYSHYKIICISLYTSDIRDLDAKIARLKERGWSKANKSQLIRIALSQLDVETMSIPRM